MNRRTALARSRDQRRKNYRIGALAAVIRMLLDKQREFPGWRVPHSVRQGLARSLRM
jgi:hypothetical protein